MTPTPDIQKHDPKHFEALWKESLSAHDNGSLDGPESKSMRDKKAQASKKLGRRIAAKACIFKDSRMLVLYKPEDGRQRSAVPNREEDLPGGCVEEGESLEEALKREVREETGLAVEVDRPFNTWSMITPARQILGVDFICYWQAGEVKLSEEHERYEWLTLEEIQAKHWEQQAVYEDAFAYLASLT